MSASTKQLARSVPLPAREAAEAPTSSRRILHVFPSFEVGGAQMRFTQMVRELGPSYQHTVISLREDYGARQHIGADAPVDFVAAPAASNVLGRLAGYRAKIAALSPAALVTYNWGAIEWGAANLLSSIPHIHVVDGFGPDEAQRQFLRRIWARRIVLQGATVVAPSLTLRKIALNIWGLRPERVLYIPNGVAPQDDYRTALSALAPDLPPGRPRIVWAGAMRREKNLVRLLQAFSPMRDEAVLVLIGDGPERPTVEREIEASGLGGSVKLLGQRGDARDLIMQCDLMALSSDTEQMPLCVLEAMDAGLPVVATDVGDIKNMVAPEGAAFVVPPSHAEMTTALRGLLADKALRVRLGQANRERVRSDFSMAGMCASYRTLFAAA